MTIDTHPPYGLWNWEVRHSRTALAIGKAKHPPYGLWNWEVRPVDSKTPQLAIFVKGDRKSSGRIATVPLREGRHALCLADAELIAAAPDLISVCLELAESASYWSDYDVPIGIVDRLNAAIAKATGQAREKP